jgi:AraC-like DNA-binding protein
VFAPEGGGEETAAWRALGRLLEVVTELRAAAAATEASGRRDDWLERSRRTLGQRRAGRWATPQEAAREAGLSYENFRKRFAAATGEAPGHYQKRRRLEAACAAIYAGERTLKDIADELGFCDVFHFSKAFKQVIGASPSEYRRRVRGS